MNNKEKLQKKIADAATAFLNKVALATANDKIGICCWSNSDYYEKLHIEMNNMELSLTKSKINSDSEQFMFSKSGVTESYEIDLRVYKPWRSSDDYVVTDKDNMFDDFKVIFDRAKALIPSLKVLELKHDIDNDTVYKQTKIIDDFEFVLNGGKLES